METPHTGYRVQSYSQPVKRYCQTLNLKENPELIAEYRKRHLKENAWPEILEGIREVGILEMEIYILGSRLFMIVETPLDFDWDEAMQRFPASKNGKIICLFSNKPNREHHRQRNGSKWSVCLSSTSISRRKTINTRKRGCKEIIGQHIELVS